MKLKLLSLFSAVIGITFSLGATVHTVTSSGVAFTPSTLNITAGDTVTWTNVSGNHNVNGSLTAYPSNPEGFINGVPSSSAWTYSKVFTVPGTYGYKCDLHAPTMVGTINVSAPARDLVLTAMFDGPLTGGNPKGVEIYALTNITDLSSYGIGSANNGGGTDSVEFQFPAVAVTQGDYIYVTTDSALFHSFFGFAPDYVSGAMAINGDDAVELFNNGVVIDVFGDINVDGTGTAWEYLDSWAYRNSGTGPDSSNFVIGNWTFGGINTFDGKLTNASATPAMPIGTYSPVAPTNPTVSLPSSAMFVNEGSGTTTIDLVINPPAITAQTIDLVFAVGAGINLPGDGSISPLPNLVTGVLQLAVPANEDTVSFSISIIDDAIIEGNETLFVKLNAVSSGLTIASPDSMIFVVEDNDFATSDIASITTVDANFVPDSLGKTFITHGVVYTDDFDGNAGLSFYMYDNTGGINVFNFNDVSNYVVTRGDSIMVIGEIEQYRGLTEIVVDSINVLKTGVALKNPSTETKLDESTEGEFIQLDYWWFIDTAQWGSGSFNMDITNGKDTGIMRIDSDINLSGAPLPTAGMFSVRGAGSQFTFSTPANDGYQIFPRDSSDIIPINEEQIGTATTNDANLVPVMEGQRVILSGVVYTDDFDGNNGISFYMADATGGINVFNFNDVSNYVVTRGDSIRVIGEIIQFRGLTEIFADSIEVLNTSVSLPAITTVTTLDETTESEYIRMDNMTFVDTTQWGSGSSFNVDITNGTDTFTMRIDSDINLSTMPLPTKGSFSVIGAGSQFTFSDPANDGYQIFPRDDNDIITNVSLPEFNGLEISLYPNPAKDVVYIERNNTSKAEVVITNVSGVVVSRFNTTDTTVEISTENLSSGVYTISIIESDASAARKVVISK